MESIPLYSFVGPEGAGKSSQAKLLATQLVIPCISTGDMIRSAAENDFSEIGDECRQILKDHTYLSGPTLLKMVTRRLKEPDIDQGVILDGGFRTMEETENFRNSLAAAGREFNVKIIYLRIPFWETYNRLLKDNRGRKDDNPEAIAIRVDEFRKDLVERVNYLKKNWSFCVIIASGKSIETVNKEVSEKIIQLAGDSGRFPNF